MANLADVIVEDTSTELGGNSEAARKALTEAVTAPQETKPTGNSETTVTQSVEDLPEKFKGKSSKQIVEMYQNLESRMGTMANDLGVQRQLTDRILNLKRYDDLEANGGGRQERQKPTPVTTNDILDRPQETLERVVNDGVQAVREDADTRIKTLEARLAKSEFVNRHRDYQTTVQSPEFLEWVKSSPLRMRAAIVANNGDWQVADELFTEYELRQQRQESRNQTTESHNESNSTLEEARRATYTSSGSSSNDGQGKPAGKIYKRADLMRLMIEDPEAYYDEGFQNEILLAHAEKRVR